MRALLILIAVGCAVAGITAPWTAMQVAAVLLAIVAGVYFTTRVRSIRDRMPRAVDKDFRPTPAAGSGAPTDLLLLRSDLRSTRSRAVVGRSVEGFIANVATERLREHHGIDLLASDALRRAEPLVSPELLALLAPRDTRQARHEGRTRVRFDALPSLIDEVERL